MRGIELFKLLVGDLDRQLNTGGRNNNSNKNLRRHTQTQTLTQQLAENLKYADVKGFRYVNESPGVFIPIPISP